MERFGATVVLGAALAGGAVATGAIGFFAGSVAVIEAVSCFFVSMGASGFIALAALVYPTALAPLEDCSWPCISNAIFPLEAVFTTTSG